jgi:hypothetical protein
MAEYRTMIVRPIHASLVVSLQEEYWNTFRDGETRVVVCTGTYISIMLISGEATWNPPRHSGSHHQCFPVLLDASRPSGSFAKCSQTLQEHSQVLLKAPAAMDVHSGRYTIWRLG